MTAALLTAVFRGARADWPACSLLLVMALSLGACGGMPITAPPDDSLRRAAEAQAARLGAEGAHAQAARAWLELAQAAPAQRQRYQILAAREQQLAGNLDEARRLVGQTPLPIQPANQPLWSEVAGSVLLATNEAERALAELGRGARPSDPAAAARLLALRAEALFQLRQPADAVSVLLEREAWLADGDSITANRQRILEGVRDSAPAISRDQLQSAAGDPLLAGWLELGYLYRTTAPGEAPNPAALAGWRERFGQHPAAALLFPDRRQIPVMLGGPPRRLALLLPLSGRQQALGEAVRDGFLAAHFTAGEQSVRPEILVYDVAALGVAEAYRQAVDNGARLIVGPLLKESVQELATITVGTPVLALNSLPDGQPAPPGMFQFGLYPEDEAAQVAQRAVADGHRRALALIPSNDWGRRMLESFRTALEAEGGVLLEHRLYDTVAADYSWSIEGMLLLGESRARHQRVSAIVGEPLAFSPRRRQDADFIFMAATAGSGKLIRPQLRYFDAGEIPSYATSAIWEEGSGQNNDLDGILFPDAPWVIAPDPVAARLRETLTRHWSADALARSRLYALGFDAWQLIPELSRNPPLGRELDGMTGRLYLGRDGRIHRQLPWAQIRDGQAEPQPAWLATPANEALEPAPR